MMDKMDRMDKMPLVRQAEGLDVASWRRWRREYLSAVRLPLAAAGE